MSTNEAAERLREVITRHSTDPIPACDDGTHHVLELARNVIEARPEDGACDHCGQFAPCTERRIAVAFVEVMEALAHERSAGAATLDVGLLQDAMAEVALLVVRSPTASCIHWSDAKSVIAVYNRLLSVGTDR